MVSDSWAKVRRSWNRRPGGWKWNNRRVKAFGEHRKAIEQLPPEPVPLPCLAMEYEDGQVVCEARELLSSR